MTPTRRAWLFGGLAGVALGAAVALLLRARPASGEAAPLVLAALVMLVWLGLVVAYYVWAIRRYAVNNGLSDHEWKVLYPALYAGELEMARYQKLNQELLETQRALSEAGVKQAPFVVPQDNPHASDSFGLPPGTVRGTLALTALVLFLSVEVVNLFHKGMETQADQLITAFMMVLAFYFGSRAVEVLQTRQKARVPEAASEGTEASATASDDATEPPARAAPEAPAAEPAALPLERPMMPAHMQELRQDNLLLPATIKIPAPPPAAATELAR